MLNDLEQNKICLTFQADTPHRKIPNFSKISRKILEMKHGWITPVVENVEYTKWVH
jgi:hypothetical protein